MVTSHRNLLKSSIITWNVSIPRGLLFRENCVDRTSGHLVISPTLAIPSHLKGKSPIFALPGGTKVEGQHLLSVCCPIRRYIYLSPTALPLSCMSNESVPLDERPFSLAKECPSDYTLADHKFVSPEPRTFPPIHLFLKTIGETHIFSVNTGNPV